MMSKVGPRENCWLVEPKKIKERKEKNHTERRNRQNLGGGGGGLVWQSRNLLERKNEYRSRTHSDTLDDGLLGRGHEDAPDRKKEKLGEKEGFV